MKGNKKINALILAGGKSTRMGEDKASLNYHGQSQIAYLYELLTSLVDRVYLSCRADQKNDVLFAPYNQIHDSVEGSGPLVGMISAFKTEPDAFWLVIACDLPFVDTDNITHLINQVDSSFFATCYKNPEKGWPEPLLTLYSPNAYEELVKFKSTGVNCPRKILFKADIKVIEPLNNQLLVNANTPEDYQRIKKSFGEKKVLVKYFASMRDERGVDSEEIITDLDTVGEVYQSLNKQYHFYIKKKYIKVAINNRYQGFNTKLNSGDTLAFIPPVAGG